MGRPSVAPERRRQIIDAAVTCMATHGVGGTTLERIADIAQMARGHVRHFAGNRDDLLIDAARVFFFGEVALDCTDVDRLRAEAPLVLPAAGITGALDYLFGAFAEPGQDNAATLAFIDAGRSSDAIHGIIAAAYASIEASLAQILATSHPDRPEPVYRAAAYSIVAIAIGNSFLNDIETTDARTRDARDAAEQLLAGFAGTPPATDQAD